MVLHLPPSPYASLPVCVPKCLIASPAPAPYASLTVCAYVCGCPPPPAAAMEEEESGWKYIHGDVFRFPANKSLFCSFVGTGTQVGGRGGGGGMSTHGESMGGS